MSEDKVLHLIVGACIYFTLVSIGMRRPAAVILVFIVAINKEVYDLLSYGGAGIEEAFKDISATMILPIMGFIATIKVRHDC